jgi:hypothetical protein
MEETKQEYAARKQREAENQTLQARANDPADPYNGQDARSGKGVSA